MRGGTETPVGSASINAGQIVASITAGQIVASINA